MFVDGGLFELHESRKTLTITKDNVIFTVEEELGKLGVDGVLAYFSYPRGERRHGGKDVYILQRWTEKWKTFVDVPDVDQIQDGDRLTIVQEVDLLPHAHSTSSIGDQQGSSFDASHGHVSVFLLSSHSSNIFNAYILRGNSYSNG